MSITTLQRWVLSSLVFLTLEHLAAGLVVAALYIDETMPGNRIGLLVIASAFGTIAVGAALLIHKRRLLSPWLLLGALPAAIGAYLCFGR